MPEMRFASSRGGAPPVSLSRAMTQGLAPDGGLYVPTEMPRIDARTFPTRSSVPEIARLSLAGFFTGDGLHEELAAIADSRAEFSSSDDAGCGRPRSAVCPGAVPRPDRRIQGLRGAIPGGMPAATAVGYASAQPLTILVATSGDTGGAVAAAFYRRAWARVVILYPRGLVSPRQERQLTCWGENVLSLRVDGTFDDCQGLVKKAFRDPVLSRTASL